MRPFLIIVILFSIVSCSTERKVDDGQWIQRHAREISIDPKQVNFDDLELLRDAVGNSDLVLLGEADHGDGSTFYLKSRLVKYFHEQMGFNVLAFESPFYPMQRAWEKYSHGKADFKAVKHPIYNMWRDGEGCQNLFSYIEKSGSSANPIILTGIDSRHGGDLSPAIQLDSLLDHYKISLPFKDQVFFLQTLHGVLKEEYQHTLDTTNQERFVKILEMIQAELSKTDVDRFWIQELENLRAYSLHAWRCVVDEKNELYNNSRRDKQMASNTLWLLREKYKGQKIIVWVANMHAVKNYSTIDTTIYSKEEIAIRGAEHSMGEYVAKVYPDVCAMITISYGGKRADFDFKEYPWIPFTGIRLKPACIKLDSSMHFLPYLRESMNGLPKITF